jgi:hypothetical protein
MGQERVLMRDCGDGLRRADIGNLVSGAGVNNKTAAYTLTAGDGGKTFGTRGASGSITFTLPSNPVPGLMYFFNQAGVQNIVITATGGAKINNGSANGSVTVATTAPGFFWVVADGTGWSTTQITSSSSTDLTLMTQATVAVTAAQIKGLRATPKTLVAAPGAGKILQFVDALIMLDAGSEGLTETADNMAIKYTDGSGVAVSNTIEATGFIDQTGDTYTSVTPKADAIVAVTGNVNKALVLHNIGDGEYAGNASNDAALKVFINYRVLTA